MPRYIKQYDSIVPVEFCESLIRRFDSDSNVRADPQPEYSTRRYLNISQSVGWIRELTQATQYADPLIAEYFRLPEPFASSSIQEWLNDGFVLAKYAPGDACGFHDDAQSPIPPANGLRYLTVIFFLNDVADGGELHFPVQDVKIKPKRGSVVVFPAQLTHPHEVLETRQDRYVLQTWVIDPNLIVTMRDEDFAE